VPPEPGSTTLLIGEPPERLPGDDVTGAGADGDVGTDTPGTETVGVGAGTVGVGAGSAGTVGVGTGTVGVGTGTVGAGTGTVGAGVGSVGVGSGEVTVGTGSGEVVIVGTASAAADPV
jgi:hypothetical protein